MNRFPDLEAELAWAQEQAVQLESGMETPIKPSYFNSGCCVYSDASLTGIEIADGARFSWCGGRTAMGNSPEVWARASLQQRFGGIVAITSLSLR